MRRDAPSRTAPVTSLRQHPAPLAPLQLVEQVDCERQPAWRRALEVVLGCDDVPADLAEAWGWVNRALPAAELWPHVDRLAARIASFPQHAVAAAKASVLRAEKDVVADLQAEAAAFQSTLGDAGTRDAMQRFLATGGQTATGEARLGDLAAELHAGRIGDASKTG